MIEIKTITDVGRVRDQNEDTIRVAENKFGHRILILADGMGGHNAGDVASQMACELIGDDFENLVVPTSYTVFLKESMLKANKEIYKNSIMNPAFNKMGTTTTILILADKEVITGHIGDSRLYFINNSKIEQITKDHTLVRAMVEHGTMVEGEEKYSKYKNVLLQALGTSRKITVEIKQLKLPKNYCFLLCSDGLTGEVTDKLIYDVMRTSTTLESRLEQLVAYANELDGTDNVSVMVLENRSNI